MGSQSVAQRQDGLIKACTAGPGAGGGDEQALHEFPENIHHVS